MRVMDTRVHLRFTDQFVGLMPQIKQVMAQDIAVCTGSAEYEDDDHARWLAAIRRRAPDLVDFISRMANAHDPVGGEILHAGVPRFPETFAEWKCACALVTSTNE